MGKFKICKSCGQTCQSVEKVCSKCGADIKTPIFKKWWFWLIIAVVFIFIMSLGSTDNKNNDSSNTTTESTTTESTTTESTVAEKTQFSIGEEAVLRDATVIVNKIDKSNGSDFDKPKEGCEYVIVAITIKNTGKNDVSYNPYDFEMQNSKGQVVSQTFSIIDSSTSLSSGTLIPGGEVSGTLVFEQPKDDNGLILKYNNNIFSNKEIRFKL